MKWKKFLSTALIGAFIAGMPAFAQTVSASPSIQYLGYAQFSKDKQKLESLRQNYEMARRNYENARKSGNYSKSELKKLEKEYLKAKKNYEDAKKETDVKDEVIKRQQEQLKEIEKARGSSRHDSKFGGIG